MQLLSLSSSKQGNDKPDDVKTFCPENLFDFDLLDNNTDSKVCLDFHYFHDCYQILHTNLQAVMEEMHR